MARAGRIEEAVAAQATASEVRAPLPFAKTILAVQRLIKATTETQECADGFSLAAVHHLRARSLLAMSEEFCCSAWLRAGKHPRKFFSRHRGLAACDSLEALPGYRSLYLRAALSSAERALELAPTSLECCTLLACCYWALTENGSSGGDWAQLLRAACERGLRPPLGCSHEAELVALYGSRVPVEASYAQRRALLQSLLAPHTAVSPPPTDTDATCETWSVWMSPWKGAELTLSCDALGISPPAVSTSTGS
jgi:hypothetical protein